MRFLSCDGDICNQCVYIFAVIDFKADANYVSTAYCYWMSHERELRILFEYIKRGATLSISAPHGGILSELEYVESKMKHRSINKITSF